MQQNDTSSFKPVEPVLEKILGPLKPAMDFMTAIEFLIPITGIIILVYVSFKYWKLRRLTETKPDRKKLKRDLFDKGELWESIATVVFAIALLFITPLLLPH